MAEVQNADETLINQFHNEFVETMELVHKTLGEYAFRNFVNNKYTKKFHPAIFDAISVAFYFIKANKMSIKDDAITLHTQLLTNEKFKDASTTRTTDVQNITERVRMALECFGE